VSWVKRLQLDESHTTTLKNDELRELIVQMRQRWNELKVRRMADTELTLDHRLELKALHDTDAALMADDLRLDPIYRLAAELDAYEQKVSASRKGGTASPDNPQRDAFIYDYEVRGGEFKSKTEFCKEVLGRYPDWCKERDIELPEKTPSLRTLQRWIENCETS